VVFGDTRIADRLAANIVVAGLVELKANAVKPKPLASRAELAITTATRVRTALMMQPFPALTRA